MPIVRNTSGHEQIHISNLKEIHTTTDELELLHSVTNTHLTAIKTAQTNGTQKTKNKTTRTEVSLLNAESLSSLQLWGVAIDCEEYSSIRFIGIATDAFNLYGSIDDTNYYKLDTVFPETNPNHLYHFNHLLQNPPRYIKIKNGSSSISITLDYSLLN
tara:strand:+ start:190 stop:663 length:474 start_codon:yes stop_codon:yes gene_type:complete